MKKNLFALLLAVALCLGLAACGSDAGKTSSPPDSEVSNSQSTPTPDSQNDPDVAADSKWPSSSVNLYVPATAGGGTDMLARLFAKAIGDVTGQSFVVINDTTGGGAVAAETIRNSKPDGLNILLTTSSMSATIASGQYAHGYDAFAIPGLITTPGEEGAGIFVKADSPYETFEDLVKFGKENPGELVSGIHVGGASTFGTALLEEETGMTTTLVEAGSDAERITALLGGSIDLAMLNVVSAAQYVESGDMRCLALTNGKKSEMLPDVPILEDYGYDSTSVDLPMMGMLMLPKDMSAADLAKIESVLKEVNQDQELQEGLAKLGMAWEYNTMEESVAKLNEVQEGYNAAYAILHEKGIA